MTREAPLPHTRLGPGRVVDERRGDNAASPLEQALGMAGDLGTCDRETHVREQPVRPALADHPLGALVRLSRCRADSVQPQRPSDITERSYFHADIVTDTSRPTWLFLVMVSGTETWLGGASLSRRRLSRSEERRVGKECRSRWS